MTYDWALSDPADPDFDVRLDAAYQAYVTRRCGATRDALKALTAERDERRMTLNVPTTR
jgi:hypothetical protein